MRILHKNSSHNVFILGPVLVLGSNDPLVCSSVFVQFCCSFKLASIVKLVYHFTHYKRNFKLEQQLGQDSSKIQDEYECFPAAPPVC